MSIIGNGSIRLIINDAIFLIQGVYYVSKL